MITIKNYFKEVESIQWNTMPEALARGHKLAEGASQNNWSAYNTNENIKRVVEAYFLKLSEYLTNNNVLSVEKKTTTKAKKEVKQRVPKPIPSPTKWFNYIGCKVDIRPSSNNSKKFTVWDIKTDQIFANEEFDTITEAKEFIRLNKMVLVEASAENSSVTVSDPELIERIDTDVQFIKRYAAMHGKVKSQAQILTLLQGLQRAILEHRIDKDSEYAKEITLIQEQLIKCYEKMGEMVEIKIEAKNLKRYLAIASSQEGMLSITLLKAYVGLHGKKGVKEKAEALINRILKAVDTGKISKTDKYSAKLNEAFTSLKSYMDSDKLTLSINRAELNGLLGIVGEDLFDQKKSLNGSDEDSGPIVVPSKELLAMDFETIGLQGKYKDLIGDPSVGFSAMVYGLPKSGKSTLCLDFAKHLAEHHGKVLFCAIEEGFGYTLKEKIERLGASHPNLFITDSLPGNIHDYKFVFIDSVSKAGMEVSHMEILRKQNPDISFVFIYHTTKEGRFKGVNTHAHEVDVIIEVAKGEAKSTGRFNAGGSMAI